MRDLLWYEEQEVLLYRRGEDPFGPPPTDPNWANPSQAERRRRARRLRRARKEVAWFVGKLRGRVPERGAASEGDRSAAQVIDACLKSLPTFHAGALALRYSPKDWPASVADHYGSWTSLVVRLDGALHPGIGTTEELEQASVARLERKVRARKRDAYGLRSRAAKHVNLALHAYVLARGDAS